MSTVNFSHVGESDKPSPSIWKDCRGNILNDLGLGVFRHVDFLGAPTGTLAAALDVTMVSFGDALKIDADTDTVLSLVASTTNGLLQIETDADDNDAAALFSEPFCRVVKNSGKKVWLEAYVASGDVDADLGVFFGLVEEAGADRDVLADNVGSNGVVTESLIGFVQDTGDDDAFDAIYRKDAGTVVEVLNDVTNATAIDSDDRASLTDDTLVKLGLKFDGRDRLQFFVDGVKVAEQSVDSTVDQSKDLCAVLGIKTGTTAAEHVRCGWFRYAYQERG